jgi:predicted Zn-dependent peptidase
MNRIVMRELACGMPLIVEVMSGVKSAGLTWLLPAGTATEPETLQGIGTIWSEMIMRGAGDRSSREHADALDRLGAARSTDVGTYHLRIGATMLGSRVLEAMPLFTEMVLRPRFEEDALGPAKDLALQAIESLKDDPYERCVVAAKSRHFAPPLNRSTLGTVEGVERITRRDVVEGWAQRARPGGAILAAAGAVDPDALAARLDELLKGWSGRAPEFSATGKPVRGYGHEQDDTNQVQIVVVHDAPAERDGGSMLEKVAINVLSGGMSGRLFTEVREKRGLCYSVSAGYSSGRDYGVVIGYVGTTPERAQESLDVLMEELERMGKPEGAVTRSEFDRAVVGMKSRLVFSGESTGARAASLAHDVHRLGRPRGLDELAGEIDAVTLDALNVYLAERKMGVVTIQTLGPAGLLAPIGRSIIA